jgi:hypothetical protein
VSTTPSHALRTKLALTAPALHHATHALWRPHDPHDTTLPARYHRYLRAMHALTTASVPLLERAAARCARLDDPAAPHLAAYYTRHADEERGHDTWLLEDLAAAGAPAPHPLPPPPPLVAELAGAQYYRIEHRHPAALLGYLAVLEGNAPAPGLADHLAARTGLPDAAFRTVRAHAHLDTGHLADLHHLLDELPLTDHQLTETAVSALHTATTLARLFHHLAADPEGQP